MALLKDKTVILIAAQSAVNVAADIANAVPLAIKNNFSVTPAKANTVKSDTIQPWMGNGRTAVSYMDSNFDVEIELATAGVAGDPVNGGIPSPGTVPSYDGLLLMGLMSRKTLATAITGTLQDGTKTEVTLAAGASAIDDFYTGMPFYFERSSGSTQASGSTAKNIVKLKVASSATDDFYKDFALTVVHLEGTVYETGVTSTVTAAYLPIPKTTNLVGLFVEVTTGAVVETRKITKQIKYDATHSKVWFDTKLTTDPTGTSTYKIKETQLISAYNGTTKVATTARFYRFAPSASGLAYQISEYRVGGYYDGTSKKLSLDVPLTQDADNATTYIVGANVTYYPNSNTGANQANYTIWYVQDRQWHVMINCKANQVFNFDNAKFPSLKVTGMGVLLDYYVDDMPTVSFDDVVKALPVNFANTTNLSIHGFAAPVMSAFNVDCGCNVIHRNMPNADNIMITKREPKSSMTFDKELSDNFDDILAITEASSGSVSLKHGVPGNQLIIYMPSVQITEMSPGDDNGIVTGQYTLNPRPGASGEPEILFVVC